MTYALQTLNSGEIEAGFFSIFTHEVRMGGGFSIPADEFCRFVAKLAIGKTSLKVKTTGEKKVEGSWDAKRKVVKLGQYEINGEDFGVFADYVFNGGFVGWRPDQPEWKPDFVKSAVDYVRKHASEAQKDSYLNSVKQKQLPGLEERL